MENYIDLELVSVNEIGKFVEEFFKSNNNLCGLTIYKDNKLVTQISIPPYSCHDKRQVYSISKSFTATAIGFAWQEKLLSLDDLVIDFFRDELPQKLDVNFKKMKVKHLLSMTTGHDVDPTFEVVSSKNWVQTFLKSQVKHEPGTFFIYNTAGTYMLSAIITKITGETVFDYLTKRLFQPLNIKNVFWNTCERGFSEGGYGIHISCDDLAKLGLLYLNEGIYNKVQILSKEWVKLATSKQSDNYNPNNTIDWNAGYGYQFWINARGGFRADGACGQICYINPETNLVIAILAQTNNMQDEMDLLVSLEQKLNNINNKDIKELDRIITGHYKPLSTFNNIPNHFLLREYKCEKNSFNITKIFFSKKDENIISLNFSDGKRLQRINCGNGIWIENNFLCHLFKPLIVTVSNRYLENNRIVASYTIDNNEIIINIKYLDCPHDETLRCLLKDNTIDILIGNSKGFIDENILHIKGNYN